MTPRDSPPTSTLALLGALAEGGPDDILSLHEILAQVHQRAYGVLLLLATLPAFIPLPFGVGMIAGPLVALVGLQLVVLLDPPWIPRWLRQRPIRRQGLQHFLQRVAPALHWLERTLRPRRGELLDLPIVRIVTGLMLIGLGVLLALPIPMTNYPFGLVLVVFSVALIEHDGRLMMIAWAIGGSVLVGLAVLSESLAQWLMH